MAITKTTSIPSRKFYIDCSIPVNDGIFNVENFEKFLHDSIKINGKTGNLEHIVNIGRSNATITVSVQNIEFAKRYLKYLTKKFLKKNALKDWLRVIASDKATYQLRYYNVNADGADASSGEE